MRRSFPLAVAFALEARLGGTVWCSLFHTTFEWSRALRNQIYLNYILDEQLFADYGIKQKEWIDRQKVEMKKQTCADKSMQYIMENNGVIILNYRTASGNELLNVQYDSSTCKE